MNGKLDILYADIHINIYNMYIIYINDQATDQHYQSMVLSTYIHTYLWNYTVRERSPSWVTLPFTSNGLKTQPPTKKPSASLKASDHTLLHTEYTITQTLYLLVPEELHEKNPTDKYKFL